MKVMIIGGFLGSGKTTTIRKLAGSLAMPENGLQLS